MDRDYIQEEQEMVDRDTIQVGKKEATFLEEKEKVNKAIFL